MTMDIRKIKKLIELLEQTGIAEIEIKEGEESLRLSRYSQALEPRAAATPAPVQHHHVVAAPIHQDAPAASTTPAVAGHTIKSPMVGTLYTAPTPGAPPYVTLGQMVKAGDTLCIVEAMKMFNEIEADRSGKIVAVFVNNGDPVEYDQPLFVIEE